MKQKVRITITGITISMDLDEVDDVHDAVDQVKSICQDNPSVLVNAINEAEGNIQMYVRN